MLANEEKLTHKIWSTLGLLPKGVESKELLVTANGDVYGADIVEILTNCLAHYRGVHVEGKISFSVFANVIDNKGYMAVVTHLSDVVIDKAAQYGLYGLLFALKFRCPMSVEQYEKTFIKLLTVLPSMHAVQFLMLSNNMSLENSDPNFRKLYIVVMDYTSAGINTLWQAPMGYKFLNNPWTIRLLDGDILRIEAGSAPHDLIFRRDR